MCGIFCEIYNEQPQNKILNDKCIQQRLINRGPDCLNTVEVIMENKTLCFFGSVLWMQGLQLTPQPVQNDRGVLLFNGDIFDYTWVKELSDTNILMEKLSSCSSSQQVVTEIKKLKGPFSLIYFDKITQSLYFSRDKIGRNSLLLHKAAKDHYVISSVFGRKYPCIEIPATHIHELNINENKLKSYSWECEMDVDNYLLNDWIEIVGVKQSQPDEDFLLSNDDPDLNVNDDLIKYIESESLICKNKLMLLKNFLEYETIFKTVEKLKDLLEKSVKVRVETQPSKCKNCLKIETNCNHCSTGILFSGGLDCTILAFLADKFVPRNQPIDLINVAFETKDNDGYDVPDRITGRQSFEELKKVCSSRQWLFHEINVPRGKLLECQSTIIGDLVYPRRTILDESLGSALWFAAQGQSGFDVTPCRILLLGSGADELFGGYVRHRNALKRHGWSGLAKELLLDWKRISFRNLARDNRVICDHGKQPRMPYLDEDFTDYVLNLKPWLKCFPSSSLECGIGDKLILRLLALHLGLAEVVTLPKRALQFGSRIANKKEKGSDISKTFEDITLTNNYNAFYFKINSLVIK